MDSSQEHDALNLSFEWSSSALRWFSLRPEQDVRSIAIGPGGGILTGGFINFDKNGILTIQGEEISYNAAMHGLTSTPFSQAPGHMGVTGVATDLVQEFIDGKTDRAISARKSVDIVRPTGTDPSEDVRFIRAAIKFAIDNATGKDKSALGGEIDIAIIRNNRTIEWVARKPWCSQEAFPQVMPRKSSRTIKHESIGSSSVPGVKGVLTSA